MTAMKVAIGTLVKVMATAIVMGTNNRFLPVAKRDVTELMADIKAKGQLEPILAWQDDDEKFHVLVGYGRTQACVNLGREVEIKVVEKPRDRLSEVLANLGENIKRVGLSPMDKVIAVAELTKLGVKQKDIAKELTCSPNYVSMLASCDKLIYPAQMLLHRGVMTVSVGIQISRMSKEQQAAECDKLEGGSCELIADSAKDNERFGDSKDVETNADPDEQSEGTAASDSGNTPKPQNKPVGQMTVVMIRELMGKIITDAKCNRDFDPIVKAVYAFTERVLSSEEVIACAKIGTSQQATKAGEKLIASLAAKADEAIAVEAARKQANREASESRKQAAKTAAEEASKNAIAKLIAAGWEHQKNNVNRWKNESKHGKNWFTTVQALTML